MAMESKQPLKSKRKLPNMPIVFFALYKTDEIESQARQVAVKAVVGKEEGS